MLKRFYVLREKLRNEGRAARGVETEGGAAEVGDDGCGEGAEERIDDMAIDGVEDNDMDDEEGIGARGKEGGDGESLDEYESYDENGDAEVDEDVDEDGDDEAGARGIEDGYRPDEEMDEIPPLEQ